MANEDRQSEHFIREVDEEMRRAQLKAIWDRFAPLIIAACVLVVVLTAGYRGWLWWQERQAAQSGDRFMAAVETLATDRPGGEAALSEIATQGGAGYPVLARLRLAGEKAGAGAKAEALAAYDAVAADASVQQSFRGLAAVRAALLALDTGDAAGATQRATPLNESGNAWRHSAREILGTAAYQGGDLEAARGYFSQIQEDAETPPDLWVRSGMMVALIDGQMPPEGTEPPAASGPAPPPPPVTEIAPAPGAPAGDFTATEPPPLAGDLAPPPAASPAPQPAPAPPPVAPVAGEPAAPTAPPPVDAAAPAPPAATSPPRPQPPPPIAPRAAEAAPPIAGTPVPAAPKPAPPPQPAIPPQ